MVEHHYDKDFSLFKLGMVSEGKGKLVGKMRFVWSYNGVHYQTELSYKH